MMNLVNKTNIANTLINAFFLISFNLILMGITGYLTIDVAANLNSRIGAFLLSFFIPIFIVYQTQNMNGIKRMLKFGFGYITYMILAIIIVGFIPLFVTGLIPCLVISLAILYYGQVILMK